MKKNHLLYYALPLLSLLTIAAALYITPIGTTHAADNMDCTLIVPANPLSAQGLATPYQLQATNPANGPCHESNQNQSVFVQAAIFDPTTGTIMAYSPLVIDTGTQPLVVPIVPQLPQNAVVGLWFGGDDNNTTLQGTGNSLAQGHCINGLRGSVFGQVAFCNAKAFFAAANNANVQLPALGTDIQGMPCPSVRDFFVVDQDQSDNVQTRYLVNAAGQTAQDTAANRAANPGATVVKNPSDNALLTNAIDPALGCMSAMAPDLADNGNMAPLQALDELQAAAFQQAPVALVPLGDPMVQVNGKNSPPKNHLYRMGVDQHIGDASTKKYCMNMNKIAPTRMAAEATLLAAAPSPLPTATNLLTFLAARFNTSLQNLQCQALTGMTSRVVTQTNDQGMTSAVTIDGKMVP